ncbi:DUF2970 domain-containing protein [Variovorax sp. J22R133]|uniref:DUF2970 domain-containing protein n=1 Tax=Variovorax brevis TaxID=3053503 RepID=UPI00257774EF|nr:DUF2970 domain-containing protein [Variovorax sp. J22R133]MDM0115143.1 DUF2970 domain-containing protein [Variovorax sp. J22R133]
MSIFLRTLRAVLWSFIGLGGRRADAEVRTANVGLLPLLAVAFVLVLMFVGTLIALVRFVVAP